MTHDARDHSPAEGETRPPSTSDVSVPELTWALVDDQIDSGEFQLLESTLLSDDDARQEYLDCIQLHAALTAHFAAANPAAAGKSPVLSFLGEDCPPLDKQVAQP